MQDFTFTFLRYNSSTNTCSEEPLHNSGEITLLIRNSFTNSQAKRDSIHLCKLSENGKLEINDIIPPKISEMNSVINPIDM